MRILILILCLETSVERKIFLAWWTCLWDIFFATADLISGRFYCNASSRIFYCSLWLFMWIFPYHKNNLVFIFHIEKKDLEDVSGRAYCISFIANEFLFIYSGDSHGPGRELSRNILVRDVHLHLGYLYFYCSLLFMHGIWSDNTKNETVFISRNLFCWVKNRYWIYWLLLRWIVQ